MGSEPAAPLEEGEEDRERHEFGADSSATVSRLKRISALPRAWLTSPTDRPVRGRRAGRPFDPLAVAAPGCGSLVVFSATDGTRPFYDCRGGRVRSLKTTLVKIPSNQPRTAAARTIQTSDAWPVPTTQLSFTCRVFATTSAIRMTSSAIRPNAQV
jgi:hypothetical protein